MNMMLQLRHVARSSTSASSSLSRMSSTIGIRPTIPITTTYTQRGILSVANPKQHQQQHNQNHSSSTFHAGIALSALLSSTLLYTGHTSQSSTSCIQQHQTTSCESSKSVQNKNDDEAANTTDYTNPPEEDEPTTCTICMINRQGPCRKYWRIFEYCMKDVSKKQEEEKKSQMSSDSERTNNGNDDDDDDVGGSSSPSMSEQCDKYMIPWITCIQSHRNLYTTISNLVFQEQYLTPLEDSIPDDPKHRIHLDDGLDLASFLTMGIGLESEAKGEKEDGEDSKNGDGDSKSADADWYSIMMDKGKGQKVKSIQETKEDDPDISLVENAIKINLYDHQDSDKDKSGDTSTQSTLPITIAYVKDQDGTLLGYEEFHDWKKARKGQEEKSSDEKENEDTKDKASQESNGVSPAATVGRCMFSMVPQKTTAIQIFALYESDYIPNEDKKKSDEDENSDVNMEKDATSQTASKGSASEGAHAKPLVTPPTQRLYYSSLIPLNKLPRAS